ncbi:MAG: hypothetical protein Q8O24_07690, partial [Gallionellaceae bacterium]|nr:hypothetical protein [Gallionellaceae bacterium]
MLKIIPMFLLCAFASQSYAATLEVTAEGWDNYGAILKFGVSEPKNKKNKINMEYIESIASSMIQRGRRDEFLEHEIQNNVRPKVVATLKQLVSEQAMPGNKVQYKLSSFRSSNYDFSSERLCFDQNSNDESAASFPWDNTESNWRDLINSKIGLSVATHEPNWLFGFGGWIRNEGGSTYCIKVKDTVAAKMLKGEFAQRKVIAIINAKIVDKKVVNNH